MYFSRNRYRVISIRFFLYAVILFSSYLCVSFYLMSESMNFTSKIRVQNITAIKLPNVVVHLDLKGFPPKLSYLKALLPTLQELGVTGLLIEYEDMFPYEGRLVNLSTKYAYNKTELKDFLQTVIHFGFDVIPLVQTFGHMEHVLKNKEFAHLRELPTQSNVICPSKSESRLLIRHMLEQIIKFHQSILPLKYFHIGADEVYHINKCKQCLQRHETNATIYLKHVKETTDFVKEISPQTTVLLWDDMLRKISIKDWGHAKNLRAEPVYWRYNMKEKISHAALYQYHKNFDDIWIASAFKGADGMTATLPIVQDRLSNHLDWMLLIQNYKFGGEVDTHSFKGIILTGWSRYFHGAPPCELLPVAIPSLYLNLLLIKKFREGHDMTNSHDTIDFFHKNLKDDLTEWLRCGETVDLDDIETKACSFNGDDLYKVIFNSDMIISHITYNMELILKYYTDDEYRQHNIQMYNKYLTDMWFLESKMKKVLARYYYDNLRMIHSGRPRQRKMITERSTRRSLGEALNY
ncbi:hexosaminidase D-like [Bicyclus anynana]|uniref:beta-N-acetylhexosaminidase n=1 Tax=Bicyclus anynana TaxID=110368 RepID=A0ABM3M0M4_BICAN|nr:hexosaminidase D-like [Bicyclus anynana]